MSHGSDLVKEFRSTGGQRIARKQARPKQTGRLRFHKVVAECVSLSCLSFFKKTWNLKRALQNSFPPFKLSVFLKACILSHSSVREETRPAAANCSSTAGRNAYEAWFDQNVVLPVLGDQNSSGNSAALGHVAHHLLS